MWMLKKFGYRVYQWGFDLAAKTLRWRKAEIIDGPGSIQNIPELLQKHDMHKPMIVTDPGLMAAGVAPKVMRQLELNGIPFALFNQVAPNPTTKAVEEIYTMYRRNHCDSFVAIGGGSAMDATKGAAARLVQPNKSLEQLQGLLKVKKAIPLLIAVPTTAGTGSETTVAAVITDAESHHKFSVMDLHLIPRYAVLDPELTTGLPPHITSTTGMDALTHAVEAYLCRTNTTKESIRYAEEATVLVFENLERVYQNGQDLDGRMNMQIASFKAGFAFTRSGVGNIHAIAHTLGGLYNTPHGLANAVILPIVLDDYGPVVYRKLAHLAELTKVKTTGSIEEKARAFIDEIYAMNKRMGIPSGFDFIRDSDIPQMITWAYAEANPVYPVPVIYSRKRFEAVIQKIRANR